jgi:LysR substrate binding domain
LSIFLFIFCKESYMTQPDKNAGITITFHNMSNWYTGSLIPLMGEWQKQWAVEHPEDPNPYCSMPEISDPKDFSVAQAKDKMGGLYIDARPAVQGLDSLMPPPRGMEEICLTRVPVHLCCTPDQLEEYAGILRTTGTAKRIGIIIWAGEEFRTLALPLIEVGLNRQTTPDIFVSADIMADSITVIASFIKSGMGASLLPLPSINEHGLSILNVEGFHPPEMDVIVRRRKNVPVSPAAESFWNFLKQRAFIASPSQTPKNKGTGPEPRPGG